MKTISIYNTKKFMLVSFVLIAISGGRIFAGEDNLVLLQSLKGNWLFSIGINNDWVSPKFNDSDWETIKVPSPWEDQGFNGYNGYAFYRRKINVPSTYKGRTLYLNMGYIDDVDEVYFNGRKIGSTGSFPPHYSTAYNAQRIYYIPEDIIIFDGSNQIAVKVYDSEQQGGIVSGDPGLYGGKASANFDVNLQSLWKFQPGDDRRRKEPEYNDSGWGEILVPAKWEDQGYRDYDGAAWYRKTFTWQPSNESDRMVIMLGKIDDIDQVYINGILVGSTGDWDNEQPNGGDFQSLRGYYIPDGVLKKNQKNVIAVRVIDTGGDGGIYEGPVGLLTQTKYIEYWRKIKNYRK
jgi:hypothetical protein